MLHVHVLVTCTCKSVKHKWQQCRTKLNYLAYVKYSLSLLPSQIVVHVLSLVPSRVHLGHQESLEVAAGLALQVILQVAGTVKRFREATIECEVRAL